MQKEILESLDGYADVAGEIASARKYGNDYRSERGRVADFVRRIHPDRLTLRVSRLIDETPTARTLRLTATDTPLPPFIAGQYVALHLDIDGVRTARPYSIASPPNQTGYWDLTIRRVEDGLVSNHLLDAVSVGDRLEASGPAGQFIHNPVFHGDTMICLAGGSGITPIMSMIREIADRGLDRRLILFYGNRSLNDAIFHEELTAITARCPAVDYVPVVEQPGEGYSGQCGYITADLIQQALADISDPTFFICGPQGMYDFCFPELEKLGVPHRRIRREMYGAPTRIWEHPGWPAAVGPEDRFTVTVAEDGTTFTARAGLPLLTAMEQAGRGAPSLCRCGECSLCRVKIVSGRVFQPAGVKVRASDRQFGYVHACMSYPIEDLTILW